MKEYADCQIRQIKDEYTIAEIKYAVDAILNLAANEDSKRKKALFMSFAILCKESVL
jgi:hypothetical protein